MGSTLISRGYGWSRDRRRNKRQQARQDRLREVLDVCGGSGNVSFLVKTISVLVLAPTYPDSANIIKQNHIHNQLQSYQRHGLLPTVIDLAPSVTGVRRDLFEGIPVIRFGVRPRGWLRGFIFRLVFQGKLRALLRKTLPQFDVVHVHNCMVQLRPLLALLQTKPLVVTCYGDDVYPSKTASLERDRRIFLRGAKMITAISQYTARLASHYVG